MGGRKLKWTEEEERALSAGVKKHRAGNWRKILRDREFAGILWARSNVDLKDKWRNMTVGGFAREMKIKKNIRTDKEHSLAISFKDKIYDDHNFDALRALQGDTIEVGTNSTLDHKKGMKGYSLSPSAPDACHARDDAGKQMWKVVQAKAMSALARNGAREVEYTDEDAALVDAYSSLFHPNVSLFGNEHS